MIKKIYRENINIDEIEEEYKPNESIFDDEDETTKKIKNIIFNELTDTERRIILLYSELESQRQVADKLRVSVTLANFVINDIRNKVIKKLREK